MLQQQVYILNTILMVLDALCVIAAGYGAFFVKYYQSQGTWRIDNNVFTLSILLVMFLNNYMMGRYGLYSDRRPPSNQNLIWSIFKSLTVCFAVLSAAIFIFQHKEYSRIFLFSFAGLSFLFILTERIIFQIYFDKFSRQGFNVRRIVVAGEPDRSKIVSDLLESQLSWGHEVIGRIATKKGENDTCASLGCIEDLQNILREKAIDEVVFAADSDRSIRLPEYLEICRKMGVCCRILPALWQPGDHIISIERCQNAPFLTIQSDNFNAAGLLYKRILDLVGGLLGTLLLFFIYPFMAVAIKLDSHGPVLFKQKRVGRNGRVFNLYKFRSMYADAEERKLELMANNVMQGALFKLKDDPRITRVGRWLRITSLDEFPQFLNVLKGEMSLVGTRPPTLEEVEKYQPEHLKRISAKPGITGLWQVSGRNKITDFEKVVELDCKYLNNWRFLNDIKILLKTIVVVMQRKGAG
ncbi:MAG: sugar transferase [Promethearchaeota archaeon]|jgi:exopolysaccharide biosynthesis polyprenyl glycosylphosphotransferase